VTIVEIKKRFIQIYHSIKNAKVRMGNENCKAYLHLFLLKKYIKRNINTSIKIILGATSSLMPNPAVEMSGQNCEGERWLKFRKL
jgi:hypothetical protein